MIIHILEQGRPRLAVALGGAGRSHALARLSSLRGSPGWLVDRDRVEEWRFDGFTQHEGETVLYGPEARGRTLAEVLELKLDEGAPYLARLAGCLGLLAERGVAAFPIAADAVVFRDDGAVLFLPPEIMRELRGLRPYAENRDTFEAINHPDLKADRLASFTLGTCLYRLAAGRFPFAGDNEEEIHEQARKLAVVPLRDLVPGFDRGISDLVLASLGRLKAAPPDLGTWRDALERASRDGLVGPVDAAESERLARESAARGEAAARRFQKRTFWEKNWKVVAIVGGVVALVGLIVGSALQGVFAKRATYGWPPRQVVETFYQAMNSLNHTLMEACVVDRAGQGEINEATNLYVIGRVQMGYEGRSNTVSAAEWDQAGRPKLESGVTVYGITDLEIEEESGEPTPVYTVRYVKWAPVSQETEGIEAAPMLTEARRTVDRVTVRRDRRFVDRILRSSYAGDWAISRIERLSSEVAPGP